MDDQSPLERARENLTGLVSILVTGIWMTALFTDQEWWLGALLFGYIVVIPATAMLFGDEEDIEEHWDGTVGRSSSDESEDETANRDRTGTQNRDTSDALDALRDRYARGELTDEQFERKLDRLLETETVEDAAEYRRQAGTDRERGQDGQSEREPERS